MSEPACVIPARPILVTGASGYLGRAAADALAANGWRVRRGVREPLPGAAAKGQEWAVCGDLAGHGDLAPAVAGCEVVVHFAGLAHVPAGADAGARAQAVNVRGTTRLAAAAALAGVRRFVFISTAQVLGVRSGSTPLSENDPPCPVDVYARSKLDAERALQEICARHEMSYTILRPPMVYGPAAPGNFGRLVRMVRSGLPLPLGRASAEKSFVGLANLCSAVQRAVLHPRAAFQTFLVCDDVPVSAAELVRRIAVQLSRPVRLVPVPEQVLRLAGRFTGRGRDVSRLFDPFVLDGRRICRELDWSPPWSLNEGLAHALEPGTLEPGRFRPAP